GVPGVRADPGRHGQDRLELRHPPDRSSSDRVAPRTACAHERAATGRDRRRPCWHRGTAEARMMGLPLGFAQPLVLLGLLSIPVLWWLLRLIPPQPRRIDFPPTRLLFQIKPKEETPQKTPWWLTLLRL